MADITKCPGTNCPMKDSCYRFTAPTSEFRQSWFMIMPLIMIDSESDPDLNEIKCSEYWQNESY